MGYSFSLKNANSVGHLVNGDVVSFLDQAITSDENFIPTIEFIDKLVNNPKEDFYTSREYWNLIGHDLHFLQYKWKDVKSQLQEIRYRNKETNIENPPFQSNNEVLSFFSIISKILSRCRTKTLLLPGFSHSKLDQAFIDRGVLRELVDIHPGDSALILQLKEHFQQGEVSILNVFSKFDKAYKKIEAWPGVLIWNSRDSVFLPIESEEELFKAYNILKYEKNGIRYLQQIADTKNQRKKYSYLFHLSDLHFGNKIAEKRSLHVVQLLGKQLSTLEDCHSAIPIITGDLMHSPAKENELAYDSFCELLKSKGFAEPIHILGNHDVDTSGIFKRGTDQKAVISSLSRKKKVELLHDLKLGIIMFDSNTGGKLAQGKIGEDQLMSVGTELDKIPNSEDFTFIATLHHHPKEIENPEWYAPDWYEAYLGTKVFEKTMKLVDADIFLQWLEARKIKLALHGHKHIPKIHSHKDINIIAAGSATGSITHIEKHKTYISYNIIKYDIESKVPVSCTIMAEEILGGGTTNVLMKIL